MRIGIVGLPNAGKSSLFNALTRAGAEAANYPFTTLEPNVAVVPVPDERLDKVAATLGSKPITYETIAFHDIAGLVRGAHSGEGLGNQFLANIRETDAIMHVVRSHDDSQVVHRHDGDVRLDRRERVVGRVRARARQRVEQRRLAGVRHPDDPDLHRRAARVRSRRGARRTRRAGRRPA